MMSIRSDAATTVSGRGPGEYLLGCGKGAHETALLARQGRGLAQLLQHAAQNLEWGHAGHLHSVDAKFTKVQYLWQ